MDRRVKERLVGATILVVLVVLIVPELLSGPKHAATGPRTSPGSEPVRNVTVDLATNKATPGTEDAGAVASASGAAASGAAPGVVPSAAAGSAARGAAAPGEKSPDPATSARNISRESEVSTKRRAAPTISTLQAQQPAPATPENGAATSRTTPAVPKASVPRESAPADGAHHAWAAQLGTFANRGNAETLERRLRAQGFTAFLASSGAGKDMRYRVRVGPVTDRIAAEKIIAKLKKAGHSASLVVP